MINKIALYLILIIVCKTLCEIIAQYDKFTEIEYPYTPYWNIKNHTRYKFFMRHPRMFYWLR